MLTVAKLTDKQKRFVDEYLIDLNATQAAIRAGYSETSAQQISAENMLKPVVASAIAIALEARSEQTGITALWVLEQAADVYREEQDRSNALKALDTVGKHVDIQAFNEKKTLEHTGNMPITMWATDDSD